MKSFFIQEPELEFGGGGRHIDVRFGLMANGPLDRGSPTAPSSVRIGVVGDAEGVAGLRAWIDKCRVGIEAKPSTLPTLFTAFPGFGDGQSLPDFRTTDSSCREISQRTLAEWETLEPRDLLIERSVARYVEEADDLISKGGVDVVICTLGPTLLRRIDVTGPAQRGPRSRRRGQQARTPHPMIWHDLFKARALRLARPVQVSRPGTFGGSVQRFGRDGKPRLLVQDDATRAWNFFAALYYKAGGTLWRLAREASDLLSCYVGVGFYHDAQDDALQTSIAQVFNERGEGVVVRGGPAQFNKDDLSPHLSLADARTLLTRAIGKFRQEHRTSPARVVIHKSSWFDDAEQAGFNEAAQTERIDGLDLLSIRKSNTRFFREAGHYPPLRGTAIELSEKEVLCYTHSSVDFYRSYPGLYVPRPLLIRLECAAADVRSLVRETLALTKMNWNSTHFSNALPITLSAADGVGDIVRHVRGVDDVQPRYSYYM
ncbi:MAG: hypothetical protein U0575_04260 [Phycisphaerales bacterium]